MGQKKKNLGGRPKKPAGEAKTATLGRVRLKESELAALQKQARNGGISLTEFVRQRLGL